jgi:two-component system response regulator MprA
MADLLRRVLVERQCAVHVARTGPDGLRMAREGFFDVVAMDVMLPGMDGFEVVRELRRSEVSVPVLFLTARDSKDDVVLGLDLGGDDYLTKPFSVVELLARLRALARRRPTLPAEKLQVDDLILDCATQEVSRGGRTIELSRTEYVLLEVLMRNAGRPQSRQSLFGAVWGHHRHVGNNTLDAFIRLLRRKIDEPDSTNLIHTVRGFGYRMDRPEVLCRCPSESA